MSVALLSKVINLRLALISQALALRLTMSLISGPPVPLPKTVFQNVHIGLQHWAPDTQTDTHTHTHRQQWIWKFLRNLKTISLGTTLNDASG